MGSKAREIITELREQLLKIRQTNGYYTDVERVTYGVLTPDQITHRVMLSIFAGDMPLSTLTNDCYRTTGTDPSDTSGWNVVVLGYLKSETGKKEIAGEAKLELLDLQADVIKCISANNRLSLSQVDRIFIKEARIEWDLFENVSMFMQLLGVKFTFASSDP